MSERNPDRIRRVEPAPAGIQSHPGGPARYVYAIVPGTTGDVADRGDAGDLGSIGLAGARVYLVVQRRIGALVHDCAAEPYDSSDEVAAAQWVRAHHQVTQLAMARWHTILPASLNTIIAPSAEKTADENLLDWLKTEHDRLRERLDDLAGKAEYVLQVWYTPAVILRQVADEAPEVRKLGEHENGIAGGLAYLHRQELERVLRRETERRVRGLFTGVYERARACSDRVKVEKIKRDDSDLRMAVNLSCLVSLERFPELQALADESARHEGHIVRLVGPLPPYSFC